MAAAATSHAINLKLLIDTKANKVLFAEASKEFVDFLFFLLSLPIGTVTKLLATTSMVGSIKTLYKSLEDLKQTYMQPNFNKQTLLNHIPSTSISHSPLLINGSDAASSTVSKNFYLCPYGCNKGVADSYVVKCPACGRRMQVTTPHIVSSNTKNTGYVQGLVSYMISDDLSVKPLSMVSSVSVINNVNVSTLEVKVGTEEGLELLRMSFQSTTVLTDVFLRKRVTPRKRKKI